MVGPPGQVISALVYSPQDRNIEEKEAIGWGHKTSHLLSGTLIRSWDEAARLQINRELLMA